MNSTINNLYIVSLW